MGFFLLARTPCAATPCCRGAARNGPRGRRRSQALVTQLVLERRRLGLGAEVQHEADDQQERHVGQGVTDEERHAGAPESEPRRVRALDPRHEDGDLVVAHQCPA